MLERSGWLDRVTTGNHARALKRVVDNCTRHRRANDEPDISSE
jgi:hypothetical protein